MYKKLKSSHLLNQACASQCVAGFLKLLLSTMCEYVSTSEAINNYWRDKGWYGLEPLWLVKQVLGFSISSSWIHGKSILLVGMACINKASRENCT